MILRYYDITVLPSDARAFGGPGSPLYYDIIVNNKIIKQLFSSRFYPKAAHVRLVRVATTIDHHPSAQDFVACCRTMSDV